VTSTTYENAAAPESDLRRRGIRVGDLLFKGIAILAALAATVLLGWIAFKVFDLAWPAIQDFGLSFIWTDAWDPVTRTFGALIFIYGTVVTSMVALLLATPLSIAIALFLTEIAPRRLAAPIATMVELLAAIPSVVLGLWGILVFGPWVNAHLVPWIQDTPLGLLPMFSGTPSAGGSIFTAALVLTIMIIPITSAICRELFIRVPKDLTDGALALGSTRWESIRGVMFAYAAPGIAAAVLLGLGRAFGEAIAVNQTIGNRNVIPTSWFESGDSLGSKIASEYVGATSLEQASSILYLAAILMVISLATNVVAQFIVVRFERARRAV
jgi:phosphate transport system permease protein